jgi:hypothetical protein
MIDKHRIYPPLAVLLTALLAATTIACGQAKERVTAATPKSIALPQETRTTRTFPVRVPIEDRLHGGHEATGKTRREVTVLVERFYKAAVADDGAAACFLLTPAMVKSVPEDYGAAPGTPYLKGKTCSVVMTKLFKHPYGVTVADLATTRVVGVHLNDNGHRGFARLHSSLMRTGEMVVERVDGKWRIAVPIGSVN